MYVFVLDLALAFRSSVDVEPQEEYQEPLLEQFEQLDTDSSSGTDNGDVQFISHRNWGADDTLALPFGTDFFGPGDLNSSNPPSLNPLSRQGDFVVSERGCKSMYTSHHRRST